MSASNLIQTSPAETEFVQIPATELKVSRIALGTWAMGGWMWGGTDQRESIATIHAALAQGINLIDTAPVYGFGVSEKIVGAALDGVRAQTVIATKTGLEWRGAKIYRNATRARIMQEIDDSLRRLRTDYIDIYLVHWPDPLVPVEETAEAMLSLYENGKIRAVEAQILPYCHANHIVTLGYGALCRGLLSGRMRADTKFGGDDLRRIDPKFQPPRLAQYLDAVQQLDEFAQRRFHRHVIQLAVRWMLDRGISVALWGGRHPNKWRQRSGSPGGRSTRCIERWLSSS